MQRVHQSGRARLRVGVAFGAVALVGGLAACTPPGTGGGGSTTTTAAVTTTTVAPGCTDTPTPVIGGAPLSVPTSGWFANETRLQGNVRVNDSLGAPTGFGCNSVRMETGPTVGIDKAQLFSFDLAGTALDDLDTLSYWAYKKSGTAGVANPATTALNVQFTHPSFSGIGYLVYEPYVQSGGNAGVLLDTWQHWNATSTSPGDGKWWSGKITTLGDPGNQSNPQPLSFFKTAFPGAQIVGYGFNIGSNNPSLIVGGEGLEINGTTTNF